MSFLSAEEVKGLRKLPAATTHEAGKALAAPKARKNALKKTGLKKKRLDSLARLFDLMRVKGLGPKMALLFHATGVSTCAAMAKQDADDLAKRLLETNAKTGIANKVPDATMLKDWITQAKSLPAQYTAPR